MRISGRRRAAASLVLIVVWAALSGCAGWSGLAASVVGRDQFDCGRPARNCEQVIVKLPVLVVQCVILLLLGSESLLAAPATRAPDPLRSDRRYARLGGKCSKHCGYR